MTFKWESRFYTDGFVLSFFSKLIFNLNDEQGPAVYQVLDIETILERISIDKVIPGVSEP